MKYFATILCALLLAMSVPGQAWTDDESKGEGILRAAADYLTGQEALAFEADITYVGLVDGDEERLVTEYGVAIERPNAISVHMVNPEIDILFASTGEELIRYVPTYKQFVNETQSLSAAEVIGQAGFQVIEPALDMLGELVDATPFSNATKTSEVSFVGEESVNEILCDRIRLTYGEVAFDMWIQQEGDRVVRRFAPDMSALEVQLGGEVGVDFKIDVTATFSKWTDGPVAAQRAKFHPPENSELVTAFHAPSPADALKGEPAPDFTVALLDGGSLTLSERKGEIVILDFWATWCGPCRVAMPVLTEVSAEFADKGVELYGVNLMEDPEHVRAFLEGQGLKLNVALDTDGAVGSEYKAEGIPQTVVIGRDGVIKIVHVGLWAMPEESAATREEEMKLFHDALANSLRAELQELIAAEGAAD